MISRPVPRRHPRVVVRGFTLIELVVVVGIIIALLSLVLAVSTLLIQQNEARQLESAFANLETAILEYEQAVGRPMTFQDRSESSLPGAYDVPANPDFGIGGIQTPYNDNALLGVTYAANCASATDNRGWGKFIVQLLSRLSGTQSAEDIIARLDPSLLVPVRLSNGQPLPNNGSLSTLVDPWGSPIAVVFPGRQWREGDSGTPDADGTIRTYFEHKAGICRNGKILFVSAGPDGDLGNLACAGGNSPRYEASLDNIYSYEPGNP
jgi:type II secretory pathway pseudopilin PulG